jgi:hypothetical protein
MLSLSAMYTYTAALQLTPASTRLHQQYASKFKGMALHSKLKWDVPYRAGYVRYIEYCITIETSVGKFLDQSGEGIREGGTTIE